MFLDIIRANGYQSVAFVGMAKNVGKTTAVNYLLGECFQYNYPVGMASIGRDGEKIDAITGGEKPVIWAATGTIVATAKQAIVNSDAALEIIEDTGYRGALGQVYLAKVRRAGLVEVATTPSTKKMKNIIKMMQQFGVKLVIIDGALDRASSAAPGITESAVLATGAAVNRQLAVVVKKTIARVEQLTIPALVPGVSGISSQLYNRINSASDSLLVGEDGEITIMDKKSLGYQKNLLDFLKSEKKIKAVYINGAVVDGLLEMFVANRRELYNTVLVVKNGTSILVNPDLWRSYLRAHGNIKCLHKINLIAVSCNPISPRGESFFPEELVEKVAGGLSSLNNLVAVDVITGIHQGRGGKGGLLY